ncbi:MAG: hypothetical protein ACRD0C_01255 [Acidimicrobiia bacterium]
MNAAGAVTLLAIAIIVGGLMTALLRIIFILHEVSFNLGTIVACINAIGKQTETVPTVIASANTALTPVGVSVQGLASAATRSGNGRVVEMSR